MSVNKNFVVKNGLEVNTNLIFADTDIDKVGIGTTVPQYKLDVLGGIGATFISVGQTVTTQDLVISGTIDIDGIGIGTTGQYLRSTGTGVEWEDFPVGRTATTITATNGQTVINYAYSVGLVDIFINGIKLTPSEFTASDGVTIVLSTPCFGGEVIDIHAYSVKGIGIGNTGITGLTILDEGTPIGNLQGVVSIDFVGAGITASVSGAGITVSLEDLWSSNSNGIYTIGNVGIGTTSLADKLTVEGNSKFTGITSFIVDTSADGGPGISTVTVGVGSTALYIDGNARVTGQWIVGSSSIVFDGTNNTITVGSGVTIDGGTGEIKASSLTIGDSQLTQSGIVTGGDLVGFTTSGDLVGFTTSGDLVGFTTSGDLVGFTTSGDLVGFTTSGDLVGLGGGESYWTTAGVGIHTLSNVGIGTTNPTTKLQISGTLSFGSQFNATVGDSTTGQTLTSGCHNNFFGQNSGQNVTTGSRNNFLGYRAGCSSVGMSGCDNNFMGSYTGQCLTYGSNNNFFGRGSGNRNTTGCRNNFFGEYAGRCNTTGYSNNFFGRQSGHCNSTGCFNNFFGEASGYANISGCENNAVGRGAARNLNGGCYNNFFGSFSGYNSVSGSKNIYFGSFTGISCTQSYKIVIGSGRDFSDRFDSPDTTKDTQFAVGIRTSGAPSSYWLVGDENFNIGIGTTNPTSKLTVQGDVSVGINTSTGVILTSPNGTKYRLIVDDLGALSTVSIP